MIPPATRDRIRESLRQEVGGFFTNTIRDARTCSVCTGPAAVQLCSKCANQRRQYGNQLADQVVLLAYAKGNMNHQSGFHVTGYKRPVNPSAECLRDLKLMMLGGTLLHGECIARAFGWWDTLTFVSSANRPGPRHPVVELARQVSDHRRHASRILLDIGPDIDAEPQRFPLPHRFIVSKRWHPSVEDRHVLVVDDTWVSGAKAQSAAIALKAAGARAVTVICVARWLNYLYNDGEHRPLISAATATYDALMCQYPAACMGREADVIA